MTSLGLFCNNFLPAIKQKLAFLIIAMRYNIYIISFHYISSFVFNN